MRKNALFMVFNLTYLHYKYPNLIEVLWTQVIRAAVDVKYSYMLMRLVDESYSLTDISLALFFNVTTSFSRIADVHRCF